MANTITQDEEEAPTINSYKPLYNPLRFRPVLVKQHTDRQESVILARPFFGPLLFDNNDSDARDHCANERTFLSWLRLGVYMAIVSTAIIISFHLKNVPSDVERRIALPLGLLFWLLAVTCLVNGLANYLWTVRKYSRRQALVQSGWLTQTVFTVVSATIVIACIIFLTTGSKNQR